MMKTDLHLHSKFSDGENTIEEMVKTAVSLNYAEIAFADHVRRESDWIGEYRKEIERMRERYPRLSIRVGIEAKVTDPRGSIDADDSALAAADLVLGSFHRIPKGEDIYLSREEAVQNPAEVLALWETAFFGLLENSHVDIVAHPTGLLKKLGIVVAREAKIRIARKAAQEGKVLEKNIRYQVPDEEFLQILLDHKVPIVLGSDSHCVEDLKRADAALDAWSKESI